MSGGHGLYLPAGTAIHRLRPQAKVAATLAFVFAVVATPSEAFWAFGVDAALLAVVARSAAVPLARVGSAARHRGTVRGLRRVPPLVGEPPRTDVLGLSLSEPGLWAAWNILIKGTVGVAATVLLGSTTSAPDLLAGLDRPHVPRAFTAIAGFMVRYGEVITGEARRMRVARLSRGHDPRWIWQARAIASSAGTLFIRAYERGERVHLAMFSRGFTGQLPPATGDDARPREWAVVSVVPALAAVVAVVAWLQV